MAAKTTQENDELVAKTDDMASEKIEQPVENVSTIDKTIATSKGKVNTPLSGLEEQFLGKFMSPMFSKMEEAVQRNTKVLDEIQAELEADREVRRKTEASKHIPETIKEYGQDLTEIMQHLEKLVLYENYDENTEEDEPVKARLKTLDANSETMVLTHSIAAYVSTLEPSHLKYLANKIVSDTTLWLSRLFRLENSSAYFHEEEREGLVRIARLALHKRYPEYVSEGFMSLQGSPPVIYVSAASRPGLGMHLCTQLGLPVSCICTVPLYLNTHKMDVVALERLMREDKEAGKTPLMVIAYAGTPVLGHVDDLMRIQALCTNNQVWHHIEGNGVALLSWFSVPTNIRPVTSGDSLAINLGGWLGLPAVPYVTLYKTPEDIQHARAAGLTYYNAKFKLNCMPVWVCLQNMGHYGIVEKIEYSVRLAKQVHETVNDIETLRNVALCEIENPTVVFRYTTADENPDNKPEEKDKKADNESKEQTENQNNEDAKAEDGEQKEEGEEEENDEEEVDKKNPYFDALNIWLCETLKRDCPKVHIAAIEIANEGVCIRFAPMESIHDYDTTEEEVGEFIETLKQQLAILDATVRQHEVFNRICTAEDKLRSITLPNWAGLGAVQYIPEPQRAAVAEDKITEYDHAELNKINYELVHQLKSQDTAFSLGHSAGQMFCVRFGLVTDETDLEELIGLVRDTGSQIEESSKFLDTMAEVIREGIEKAEHDLEKENISKIQQEGVLRQLPMVGSLLNWWSPPPKDPIKGRTFNLASRKITSTEETYKYHMQIQEEQQQKQNAQRVRTTSTTSQESSQSSSKPVQQAVSEPAPQVPSTPPQQEAVEQEASGEPDLK